MIEYLQGQGGIVLCDNGLCAGRNGDEISRSLRRNARIDDAIANGDGGRLRPVGRAELAGGSLDMLVDGPFFDPENC